MVEGLTYICDRQRHLICVPYSKANLHRMAHDLRLGRHWFHKDHYDMPILRLDEIGDQCTLVSTRNIVKIIKGEQVTEWTD